jgi:pectate lyase
MRKAAVLLSAAALVFGATELAAQATPSFAAKWTMVGDPSAAPGGGRGGLGREATIVQDAKTLTITRTTQNGEIKSVYNLDGTDSKNTMTFGGNSIDQISKLKWDGSKLVITTSSSFNGNAFETTMALSLDADGNLVVDATAPGRGGGAPTTTKLTYKKS